MSKDYNIIYHIIYMKNIFLAKVTNQIKNIILSQMMIKKFILVPVIILTL